MRVVVALGGNALLPRGVAPDAFVQQEHIARVGPTLARFAPRVELVVTHGNGPQVGMLAIESSTDAQLSRPYPFDALVAETQGLIGYWLQQSLQDHRPAVTVITQTVVDADDPAFDAPTKFIGPILDDAAREAALTRGWAVGRDGGRWRRTIASPRPVRVVELPIIADLLERGTTVICAGGGGAPVVDQGGRLRGVEAVVDKDLVAALLAIELGAQMLVLLTDVAGIYTGYGTADAELIGRVTPDQLDELSLPPGSMGPKAEAAGSFARATGGTAVIGALDELGDILLGQAGTHVKA